MVRQILTFDRNVFVEGSLDIVRHKVCLKRWQGDSHAVASDNTWLGVFGNDIFVGDF